MIKNNMCHIALMCIFSFLLFSCDKEVSDVGGEILTNSDISTEEFTGTIIQTENSSLEAIESNNLAGGYLLGTSKNDKTGDTKYGILLRTEPTTSTVLDKLVLEEKENSTVKLVVKSATMIIPYTYRIPNPRDGDMDTFVISEIIKDGNALELDVFRNEYNLQLTSTVTNANQTYYANASNGPDVFKNFIEKPENNIVEKIIDNKPNGEEFKIKVLDDEGEAIDVDLISDSFENLGKTLRIELKKDFFGDKLVDAEGVVINKEDFNSTNFLEKFKGLYIKPKDNNETLVKIFGNSDGSNNDDSVIVKPKIEVVFAVIRELISNDNPAEMENSTVEKTEMEEQEPISEKEERVVFDMNRQIIDIVSFEKKEEFTTAFNSKETALIKGGVAATDLKLFGNSNQLDSLFNKNIIVNQAVLRFQVNSNSPLYNESVVPNILSLNLQLNGRELSRAEIETSGDKMFYNFTVTEHLKSILNRPDLEDAITANRDLIIGVSEEDFVTENDLINIEESTRNSSLAVFDTNKVKRINTGSLQSTKEVPLYGSAASEDKKPQLIIKFTSTK